MSNTPDNVCAEHGQLKRSCTTCEAIRDANRVAELEAQVAALEARNAGLEKWVNAWRNRFVQERQEYYRRTLSYELARASAENDANEFADAFERTIDAAIEREGK